MSETEKNNRALFSTPPFNYHMEIHETIKSSLDGLGSPFMWTPFFAVRNHPSIKRRLWLRKLDWSMIKLFSAINDNGRLFAYVRNVCLRPRVYEAERVV